MKVLLEDFVLSILRKVLNDKCRRTKATQHSKLPLSKVDKAQEAKICKIKNIYTGLRTEFILRLPNARTLSVQLKNKTKLVQLKTPGCILAGAVQV